MCAIFSKSSGLASFMHNFKKSVLVTGLLKKLIFLEEDAALTA